jgi:ribosomal protein L13
VDSLSYKTISANAATVDKQWVVIDATDEVLGRLASQVAKILRGKNKPSYTPHVDCGDYVIVINADKVKLTGKKMTRSTHDTPVSREVSVSLRRPITWRRNRRFSSRRLSKACSPKRALAKPL